ncbi:hypothetical protein AALP_AA7G187500 [Arabis alpina]|uniref:DYW domain-containing protein n=1 Tax=Arabis alpina TaxID=50452 RepID=A0A087GJ02_ARAAL|nr:hypothetical protein AALP_AA7G187500 [Arabis alpina]
MIYATRASLRFSYSFRVSYGSLRNLSIAAERLGFVNPNYENPVDSSSEHTSYVNGFNGGDQYLDGFQQNSYLHSLNSGNGSVSGQNPSGFYQHSSKGYNQDQSRSFEESSNQRDQIWQSSDGSCSFGNGNGILQENGGFVHSQTSPNAPIQSWDSYNGGQSQTWESSNGNGLLIQSHDQGSLQGTYHFEQEYSSGNGSLEELDAICREGKVENAVEIIKSWRNEGYVVDLPRLLWLVQLCGDAQALEEAKVVHEFVSSLVSLSDISVYNSIIEMYSGCRSVDDALTVFNSMPEKNLQSWCGIIRCFAKNGKGEEAVDMFSRFKQEGNRPDGEIFKEIFFVCGVLGDIDEGILHFESMIKDYRIIPSMEHYVSLVKMLAEPGYLDEALGFVESMEPNVVLWETLMNLSRIHGDLELGDRCQDMVEQLDASRLNSESKAGLVPVNLSDIAKEKLQRMARRTNMGREHLAAGDSSRPENIEFYIALKSLKEHMIEMGYVPDSKLALHDVDQESKNENLLNHSERLAFIKAMLTTPARSSIMVLKNLRVCKDCHNALSLMSKIVGRLLVSRDLKRFHHMKDGVCSCNEFW